MIAALSDGAVLVYMVAGLAICWAAYGLEVSPWITVGIVIFWPFALLWWWWKWFLLAAAVMAGISYIRSRLS